MQKMRHVHDAGIAIHRLIARHVRRSTTPEYSLGLLTLRHLAKAIEHGECGLIRQVLRKNRSPIRGSLDSGHERQTQKLCHELEALCRDIREIPNYEAQVLAELIGEVNLALRMRGKYLSLIESIARPDRVVSMFLDKDFRPRP